MASASTDKFAHGLPSDASTEEMQQYAAYCLANYQEMKWTGNTLLEYFCDYFQVFTAYDFKGLEKNTRRMLRDFLRANGVYTSKGIGVEISSALYMTCQQQPPWPENDPDRPEPPGPRPPPAPDEPASAAATAAAVVPPAAVHPTAAPSAATAASEATTAVPPVPTAATAAPSIGTTYGIGSNIVSLLKSYHSADDKYSGDLTDSFELKLNIFNDRCALVGVPEGERLPVLSVMLHGAALSYFYNTVKPTAVSFENALSLLRGRFVSPEATRSLVFEFDTLNLRTMLQKHSEKSPSEVLQLMIARFERLRPCLPAEYRSNIIFRNRLLNACRDVEACRLAIQKPAETVQGVIADLQSAVATHASMMTTTSAKSNSFLAPTPLVNIVDRKFRKGKPKKRCYVCGKLGCFSTKHTADERILALRNYRRRAKSHITDVDADDGDPEQLPVATTVGGDRSADDDAVETLEDVFAHVLEQEEAIFEAATTVDPGSTGTNAQKYGNESGAPSAHIHNSCISADLYALTSEPFEPNRYADDRFFGIMIDTGCSFASTAGLSQYLAYCKHVGRSARIDAKRQIDSRFGIGSARSKGMAQITFPFNGFNLCYDTHIVDGDIPLLLSISDMDKLKLHFNNISNELHHLPSNSSVCIVRELGHPFYQWQPMLHILFTEAELRRLHRRFGHPHSDKLYNLLRRARLDSVTEDTRKMLERIVRHCQACQIYAAKPRRFKFTLRDDKDFNHSIYIDVFFIDRKPILHVVDEATRYQAARWLDRVNAPAMWTALRLCWIDVYLGPPDVIVHDAANAFLAQEFKSSANNLHIQTKCVPVEAANSMSIVERYHSPVRRAYKRIMHDVPGLDKVAALQMAVKAVNDSVGPDGIVPTLLVYGALPRLGLPSDPPAASTVAGAKALKSATEHMSEYFASRHYRDAIRSRNGPDVTEVHKLPLGSLVRVYRPEVDQWEGPYKLLDINEETCTLLVPKALRGYSEFRTTVVKLYIPPMPTPVADDSQTPTASVSATVPPDAPTTKEARAKELEGLLENGVFEIADASEVRRNRLYGTRFVDEQRKMGTADEYTKSRLVVQAFNDKKHALMTYSPTVQRSSQRLLLSLALSLRLKLFTRDISQAYTQSDFPISRPVYLKAPMEMNLPPGSILKILRTLYGLPESAVHWFQTYQSHHICALKMKPAAHDACFLTTLRSSGSVGMTCMQVDDTLNAGNSAFVQLEEKESHKFKCKPAVFISEEQSLQFNGGIIKSCADALSLTQQVHIDRLEAIDDKDVDHAQYISQRARGAYVAAVSRPDLSFCCSWLAQTTDPSSKHAKLLNATVAIALGSKALGLRFVQLQPRMMHLGLFVDASFASNADFSSQLGFVVVLMDGSGLANIVHYGSVKSKRVTRSAFSAELYAMIHGFDNAFVLLPVLERIMGRRIALKIYTDSKSLYDSCTRLTMTSEKRLLIDLALLREAYEERDISQIVWIPGHENPADALTKLKPSPALSILMQEDKVDLTPNAWVDRPPPTWANITCSNPAF